MSVCPAVVPKVGVFRAVHGEVSRSLSAGPSRRRRCITTTSSITLGRGLTEIWIRAISSWDVFSDSGDKNSPKGKLTKKEKEKKEDKKLGHAEWVLHFVHQCTAPPPIMSSFRLTLKGRTEPRGDLLPTANTDRQSSGLKKRSRALHNKGNAAANAERNKTQDSVADPLEKILKRNKIG